MVAGTVYPELRGEPRRVAQHPRPLLASFPGLTPTRPERDRRIACPLLVLPAPTLSGSPDRPVPILSGRFWPGRKESSIPPSADHCPLTCPDHVGVTAPSRSKSFRCNTYESPRKCCKQKTYSLPESFRCNLQKTRGRGLRFSGVPTFGRFNLFSTYPLSFQTLAHSFALCKMLSHLFSSRSALFAKNHPGGRGHRAD